MTEEEKAAKRIAREANKMKSSKVYDMTNTKSTIEKQHHHYYDNGSNSEKQLCKRTVWIFEILLAYAVRRELLAKSTNMGVL